METPRPSPWTLTAPRTLAQEALALSAGTLTTLTGYRDDVLLDVVHTAFVAFCVQHPQYATWQVAWTAFQATRHVKVAPGRAPTQQALPFGFSLNA